MIIGQMSYLLFQPEGKESVIDKIAIGITINKVLFCKYG